MSEKLEHRTVELYFLELDPQGVPIPEALLSSLPGDKQARLRQYRFEIDRKIGAYSEILLRCLICARLGTRFEALDIRAGRFGKPYLQGYDLEFNMSHTRCAVAAAFSGSPVGVDIERVRDIDFGIAKSVFSDRELTLLADTRQDQRDCFFEIWTKKEARTKRSGTGLYGDLKACDVARAVPGEELTSVRADGYILSVCSADRFDPRCLIKMTEEDLCALWRRFAT